MDDIYEYKCADDDSGLRFRLCIWESSRVPVGYVKWCVDRYEPELGEWVKLDWWPGGCTLDVALNIARERLNWWAENFRFQPGS